jgi:hypothetical protein
MLALGIVAAGGGRTETPPAWKPGAEFARSGALSAVNCGLVARAGTGCASCSRWV